MVTQGWYALLLLGVVLERGVELMISRRNEATQRRRGGVESGAGHYPIMVALHAGIFLGCFAESWILDRAFVPMLGYPMVAVLLLSQITRYWVINSLGGRWTTRVIVVPGDTRVRTGPYRFLRHPNYVAVVAEGIALPLIHSNWITAVLFTAANSALLFVRIRCEDNALKEMEE